MSRSEGCRVAQDIILEGIVHAGEGLLMLEKDPANSGQCNNILYYLVNIWGIIHGTRNFDEDQRAFLGRVRAECKARNPRDSLPVI